MTKAPRELVLETADDVLIELFARADVDEEKAVLDALFQKVFDHRVGFACSGVGCQKERRHRLVAERFDDQATVGLTKGQRRGGAGNVECFQFGGREETRGTAEGGEVLLVEVRDDERLLIGSGLSACDLLLNSRGKLVNKCMP